MIINERIVLISTGDYLTIVILKSRKCQSNFFKALKKIETLVCCEFYKNKTAIHEINWLKISYTMYKQQIK